MAAPAPTRTAGARAWALAGTALIVGGVVAVLALHVITLDEINPLRRTLSQYALGPWKPVFDSGVLAVAAGSAAVLAGLVRAGLVPLRGAAVSLLAAWSACLVVVVAFEKIDWSVGPTPTGYVHRYASLLAFFCLPAAALALGRGVAWRRALGRARGGDVVARRRLAGVAGADPAGLRAAPAHRCAVVAVRAAGSVRARAGAHRGRGAGRDGDVGGPGRPPVLISCRPAPWRRAGAGSRRP